MSFKNSGQCADKQRFTPRFTKHIRAASVRLMRTIRSWKTLRVYKHDYYDRPSCTSVNKLDTDLPITSPTPTHMCTKRKRKKNCNYVLPAHQGLKRLHQYQSRRLSYFIGLDLLTYQQSTRPGAAPSTRRFCRNKTQQNDEINKQPGFFKTQALQILRCTSRPATAKYKRDFDRSKLWVRVEEVTQRVSDLVANNSPLNHKISLELTDMICAMHQFTNYARSTS